MSSVRALLFPVLAAALLSSGCIASTEDTGDFDSMEVDAIPTEPTDSGSWTGANGQWPPYYQAMVPFVEYAFGMPLGDPSDPRMINPGILSFGFAQSTAGKEVFQYITRCALRSGISHPVSGDFYKGEGILVGTDHWRDHPLDAGYKDRVHACLMTFLNGFNATVDISIQSPLLVAAEDDAGAYFKTEAAWVSVPTASGREYLAFLSDDFLTTCPEPEPGFNMRICATNVGNCGITVQPWNGNCDKDPHTGQIFCLTSAGAMEPALVTKLSYCPN